MGQKDRDAAAKARQQAIDNYANIRVPTPEELSIQLQKEQSVGQYTPQQEALIQQGSSAMNGVATDPRLKQAQLQALSSLQNISNNGGRTLQDQANENQVLGQSNQQEASNRAAILQNMQTRGMAGSGFELASQLAGQQGAATRANQQMTDINAQAQQRALQAIQMGGTMSGQMQSQDFGQQAQVASANDIISRFNSQNAQSVAGNNTDIQNKGQLTNLQNNQRIADTNTGFANQQEMYNKNLGQQNFNNQIARANGMSGQQTNMAGADDSNAARTGAIGAGIGAGVGQGFAAYGAAPKKTQAQQDQDEFANSSN
jgi:hypothetical protein